MSGNDFKDHGHDQPLSMLRRLSMASLDDVTPVTVIFTDDELAGILAVMPADMDITDYLKILILGEVGRQLLYNAEEDL